MKSKLAKLKRLEHLQKRLHDLSVWKLTNLAQQRDQLNAAHVGMIDALGAGLLSFGGAASAATRRIRSLEVEISAAEAAHAAQAKHAFNHGARSRLAELAVEAASVEDRQQAEKVSLAELIEWSLQQSASGSRKP